MANRSFFTGCASREAAERLERREIKASAEVLYSAGYRIPLFWLAAFTLHDRLVIRRPKASPYTVLCAPAAEAVARLRRRREAILGVVSQRFAALYDAWIAHVEARFPEMILLRTSEIFGLTTFEDTSARLDALLRALAPADEGAPITDTRALGGFQNLAEIHELSEGQERVRSVEDHYVLLAGDGDSDWPPPPSPEAIGVNPLEENAKGVALLDEGLDVVDDDPDRAVELFEQAEPHFTRALAAKPDLAEAEFNLGLALGERARVVVVRGDPELAAKLWDEAARHYDRALEIQPLMEDASSSWGAMLNERASAIDDDDPERADALREEAEGHFERALALNPDLYDAEHDWGLVLRNRALAAAEADPDRALELLDRAGQRFARALTIDPEARTDLAYLISVETERRGILLGAGRLDEARAAGERLLDHARQDEAQFGRSYNLACALSINGRVDEALDLLERMHGSSALEQNAAQLRSDPDLAALADHPRFHALLAARA